MSSSGPSIGVIGGSGIVSLFGDRPTHRHEPATEWGKPSGPILEGEIAGTRLFFLPRHGEGHRIPPHRVNYRANIAALERLGVGSIVAINSVGSLREELPPGRFVLPSQFVDLTKQRPSTFYDEGRVVHVSLADPFCPRMTSAAEEAGRSTGTPFAAGRTYVCVEGPRFSTRSESAWYRGFADVIGMTLVPEVTLARERALCYLCLAMVTDFDVWNERAVEATDIARTMQENATRVQAVLETLLPKLAGRRDCPCPSALEKAGLGGPP